MNTTSGFCRVNGIDLHYRRTGGAGRPIVLLHGLSGDGACWTPLARVLASEYDVVMPDARGHGQSGTPPHGYRYDDHARDVIALIDELQLVAPVLLGHSMGGLTAALIASLHVRRLRGLVLADPTFLDPQRQREVFESDVAAQHRALLARDRHDVMAELRARHARRSSEIVELVASARLRTRIEAFDVLIPPNPDYRELLRAIAVPTLLVTADDGVVTPQIARELQQLNPHLQVERIAAAGHGLHYDQPERFAGVVQSFLRPLSASAARAALPAGLA